MRTGIYRKRSLLFSSPFTATDRCICRADIVELGRYPGCYFQVFLRRRFAWYLPTIISMSLFDRFRDSSPVLVPPAPRVKTLCLHVSLSRSSSDSPAEIGKRSSHCLQNIYKCRINSFEIEFIWHDLFDIIIFVVVKLGQNINLNQSIDFPSSRHLYIIL